jgi:hypothetical protein
MQQDTRNTPLDNDPDSAKQGTHAEPVINKRPNDPNWLGVGSESDDEAAQQTGTGSNTKD